MERIKEIANFQEEVTNWGKALITEEQKEVARRVFRYYLERDYDYKFLYFITQSIKPESLVKYEMFCYTAKCVQQTTVLMNDYDSTIAYFKKAGLARDFKDWKYSMTQIPANRGGRFWYSVYKPSDLDLFTIICNSNQFGLNPDDLKYLEINKDPDNSVSPKIVNVEHKEKKERKDNRPIWTLDMVDRDGLNLLNPI